jgi:hypothetical protein
MTQKFTKEQNDAVQRALCYAWGAGCIFGLVVGLLARSLA